MLFFFAVLFELNRITTSQAKQFLNICRDKFMKSQIEPGTHSLIKYKVYLHHLHVPCMYINADLFITCIIYSMMLNRSKGLNGIQIIQTIYFCTYQLVHRDLRSIYFFHLKANFWLDYNGINSVQHMCIKPYTLGLQLYGILQLATVMEGFCFIVQERQQVLCVHKVLENQELR